MSAIPFPTSDDAPRGPTLQTSAEFVSGFLPPSYLMDGVMQRRFCYSLTGQTGGGKTALALLLTASTALGWSVGGRSIERGRVVYLAGENADDVRMRWLAMAEHMGFDADESDVWFVDGVVDVEAMAAELRTMARNLGGVSLVVVDTSAAYNAANDENNNVEMGAHARRLRALTTLPGGPTVLVLCHPVKNATADNLLPRGGGAFLAEVDGNLTCAKSGTTTVLHWQGKHRGPDFEPMGFDLRPVTAERLKDSKGRNVPTVVAVALSEAEQQAKSSELRSDEDAMLVLLLEHDDGAGMTFAAIAERLRWVSPGGVPQKSKVFRVMDSLKRDKLITKERGSAVLADRGRAAAKRAKYDRDAAGATYG